MRVPIYVCALIVNRLRRPAEDVKTLGARYKRLSRSLARTHSSLYSRFCFFLSAPLLPLFYTTQRAALIHSPSARGMKSRELSAHSCGRSCTFVRSFGIRERTISSGSYRSISRARALRFIRARAARHYRAPALMSTLPYARHNAGLSRNS